MKHLHKFASVLLALVMAFALMAPAFASSGDEPNGDNQNSGSQATAMVEVPNMENHKFEAYQIFTGTQEKRDTDDAPLADIAWGTGIKGDAFLAALKASDKFGETNPFVDVTTATGVADVLKGQKDNSEMAIAFANIAVDYELDTTKVDTADPNKKLKDAEFHLSRVVKNENNEDVTVWAVVDETTHKITAWVPAEVGQTGYTAADAEGNLNGIAYAGSVLKSGNDGVFKVAGLDNGTYGLLETKAPAGYTTPKEAFTVVVTSTLSNKGEKPEVKSLNVTIGDTNGTGDASSGIVAGTIGNGQGATLPETGGTGTTIFYIVGGLLTVGAVVLLVTKKRMSVDSDK